MRHEELDTLARIYGVGALDGDDRRRFEAHLATGCERCVAVVRETDEALTRLTLEAPAVLPPAVVRTALLRRAARETATRRRLRWTAALAGAVLVGAAAASAAVAVRYEARLGQMARQTATVRERVLAGEAAVREQVAAYRATAELLRDASTRILEARGAAGASARLLWHETRGGRLFVTGLPVPPPGRTYALWSIGDGAPRPAGTFTVDADGVATSGVAPGGDVRGFAVSLEPSGGSARPTGGFVLTTR